MKFDYVEKVPISEIGAGTVVPFTPRSEAVTILVPKGLAKPDEVEAMVVSGPSLTDYGIQDGDVIAYRTNVTNKNVTPDSILVVRILSTGELLAKKVVRMETGTGKVALRSSGGDIPDKYYEDEDIQVLGVVFASMKLADNYGRFKVPGWDDGVPL